MHTVTHPRAWLPSQCTYNDTPVHGYEEGLAIFFAGTGDCRVGRGEGSEG